ncbi:MAG: factor-independent urate hydroxylase [Pyrinomonadaceae bacterium]
MSVRLVHNNYGKSRVRLMKVARRGELHELQEVIVKIAFEGEFTAVHTVGDNSSVLPTDTMKNTVYALAHQTQEIEEIESFALRLADYFLTHNPPVTRVIIEIAEHAWTRIAFNGDAHPHSFTKSGDEKRTTMISATRDLATIESGVEDLIVLKTAHSGFVGFVIDRYTTLPETTDRILATSIKANWRYARPDAATGEAWRGVRQTILETFADHDSLSVQHTLYAMGEAVLEKFADVAEISFSLPNIHCLPVDVSRFGLENDNRIFMPTDEPHGLIEARLTR